MEPKCVKLPRKQTLVVNTIEQVRVAAVFDTNYVIFSQIYYIDSKQGTQHSIFRVFSNPHIPRYHAGNSSFKKLIKTNNSDMSLSVQCGMLLLLNSFFIRLLCREYHIYYFTNNEVQIRSTLSTSMTAENLHCVQMY